MHFAFFTSPVFDIYPSTSVSVVHSFLLLSRIPLGVDTTFCPSSHWWTFRHLQFFILSSIAMNFLVDMFSCFPGSRIFCFNEHCKLSSKVVMLLCALLAMCLKFPFPQRHPISGFIPVQFCQSAGKKILSSLASPDYRRG